MIRQGRQAFAGVQDFYTHHPFPGYSMAKYRVREDLYRHANPYTLLLDASIPLDARVLDVGCGTGQLSCLLGMRGRSVTGVDFSEGSLRKALGLRERLGLSNVEFRREDVHQIRRPPGTEPFDFILCNGVIPCLPEPGRAVARICEEFARSGTFLILGLYHSWGRLAFRLRRTLERRLARSRPGSIRAMLVKDEEDPEKLASWIADQIHPPIEACYRATDVHRWLEGCGVSWVRALPPLPGDPSSGVRLFAPRNGPGQARWSWLWAELAWIWSLRNTGGYFVVIGQKGLAA